MRETMLSIFERELPANEKLQISLNMMKSTHSKQLLKIKPQQEEKLKNKASCEKQTLLHRNTQMDVNQCRNGSDCQSDSPLKCKISLNRNILPSTQLNESSNNAADRCRRSTEIFIINNTKQEIISDEEHVTTETRTTQLPSIKNIKKEVYSNGENLSSETRPTKLIENIKNEIVSDEEDLINENRTSCLLPVKNIKKEISDDDKLTRENRSAKHHFIENTNKSFKSNCIPIKNLCVNVENKNVCDSSQSSKSTDLCRKPIKVESDSQKNANSSKLLIKSQKKKYPSRNEIVADHTAKKRKIVQNTNCPRGPGEYTVQHCRSSIKEIPGKKTLNDILNEIPIDTLAKQNQENIGNHTVSVSHMKCNTSNSAATSMSIKRAEEFSAPICERKEKKQCLEHSVSERSSHNTKTDTFNKNIGGKKYNGLNTICKKTDSEIVNTNACKMAVPDELKSKMYSENKSQPTYISKQNLHQKNDKGLLKIKDSFEALNHKSKNIKPKEKQDLKEEIAAEIKCILKPFYSGGLISKDDYKDIMRRAVPKVFVNCRSSINPEKIRKLVLNYISLLKYS